MNELRRDPMSGRWAIIEHRNKIDFKTLLGPKHHTRKATHESCSFCAGHEAETPPEIFAVRPEHKPANSPNWRVRVIPDQDPVLESHGAMDDHGYGIYDVLNGIGVHEVLIEHPQHSTAIQDFSSEHMQQVLEVMQKRIIEIKKDVRFRYVLIHKNYGEASGATLKHAHSHILATPVTPRVVKTELDQARDYFAYKERCIYCDMVNLELEKKDRNIVEDAIFLALAPFASRHPFEIWILPERHETFFEQNTNLAQLAQVIITIMAKIYRLLNNPDYIITLHNGPNTTAAYRRGYWKTIHFDYHWHLEIVPRLYSYTSFELGSGFSINPVAPEIAANILHKEKLNV